MKKYILVSEKPWHKELYIELKQRKNELWEHINSQDNLNFDNLSLVKPDIIFIPHWSYIIPEKIFSNFNCVVFHMTDLPFGRGGTPLQNLIVRGFDKTKISALKVTKGIDAGPIYLKSNLKLNGTAQDIFYRANKVIEKMIYKIIDSDLKPKPQSGDVVYFKRRTKEDSNLINIDNINTVYDYIRMLDGEGYPHAFLNSKNFNFTFYNAKLIDDKIEANVRISIK
jgi:methionyl-tRNA formyltransferase